MKYKSTIIFTVVFHGVHVKQTEKAEKLNSSPVLSFLVFMEGKKTQQNGKTEI